MIENRVKRDIGNIERNWWLRSSIDGYKDIVASIDGKGFVVYDICHVVGVEVSPSFVI